MTRSFVTRAIRRTVGVLALGLSGTLGCGQAPDDSAGAQVEIVGRAKDALTLPSAIRNLSCARGSYVLLFNFRDPAEWQQIAQAAPAFVVVEDDRSITGTTLPTDQSAAPGWFHANAPGIKVLKYVPMNYAQIGNDDTMGSGCPLRDSNVHLNCDNTPVNGGTPDPNHPHQCNPISIQTRIDRALASGYDGIFFDEAPTQAARIPPYAASQLLGYINQCTARVKQSDPNKLVIINSGSYPEDLGVFNVGPDIVALEGPTVDVVNSDGRLTAAGIPNERWLAIQQGLGDEATARARLRTFRSQGGFWYYGTSLYIQLAPWLQGLSSEANAMGRPDCSGTNAPTGCGILTANQGLLASTDQATLPSCSGPYSLALQPNGNVAMIQTGVGPIWASNTAGVLGGNAVMQGDGNFVLYRGYNRNTPLWATNTYGQPDAFLRVQSDGNLVVYNSSIVPIWSSKMPAPPTSCGTVRAGEGLNGGLSITSCPPGRATLTMQLDGNLVLRHTTAGVLWASGTAGWGNLVRAFLQGDGNFVLYKSDVSGPPLWTTNTWNNPGATVVVGDDGNLFVRSAGGAVLWSTNTGGH
jgi:hypothetical protein